MKNENHLNAEISKKLRVLHNHGYYHTKISDRFSAGVSDFLIWGRGRSAALEVKFVKNWPSDAAALLDHTFTGPQLTFMESIELTKNPAFGLVAVEEARSFFLIPYNALPESGNWATGDFRSKRWIRTDWMDVQELVNVMLGDLI
jgi:penicillin-binding protein-related factor A (putative recombinase)